MQINETLLTSLEDSSCLLLSPEERARLPGELEPLLTDMAKLKEIDTNGVPECVSPLDNVNVFRNDFVQPSLERELFLRNAAKKNDEFIIAPKTVD